MVSSAERAQRRRRIGAAAGAMKGARGREQRMRVRIAEERRRGGGRRRRVVAAAQARVAT